VKCQEPYAIVGCNQSTCIHSTNSTHLHPFHKFDPLYLLYKLNQSICLLLYPFYKFRERDCWFTPTICLLSVTSLIHQSCPWPHSLMTYEHLSCALMKVLAIYFSYLVTSLPATRWLYIIDGALRLWLFSTVYWIFIICQALCQGRE
jgi:hypothetical protein